MPVLQYAQTWTRTFRHLGNEHSFWNCSTFLRKHQILSNYCKNNSLIGSILEILICDQVYQVMMTKREQLQKLQMSKI